MLICLALLMVAISACSLVINTMERERTRLHAGIISLLPLSFPIVDPVHMQFI